jgi:D-alanyl-D-alanine carboxypeptidase/D-alanyl-D-alanine-endopeptidase (penicillin-binding protein 4)
MRKLGMVLGVLALLLVIPSASPAQGGGRQAAQRALDRVLAQNMRAAGSATGAEVMDLTTGRLLYAQAAATLRMPASVEKLYTTSTILARFGPQATLATTVLGLGSLDADGTWHGTLYLRGGGDPTFGSRSFDSTAYGTGATMQDLVANLLATNPAISRIEATFVGDESMFDSLRGTAPYAFRTALDIGGPLSALDYDRGLADEQGTALQDEPARFAVQQLVLALRAAGVTVPRGTPTATGTVPQGAQALASVQSPPMATLIRLTNVPSDNFLAEMLLKDLGARFGAGGSTAAGAAVVRAQLASEGIHPQLEDGSGLSRRDRTSPRQLIALLARLQADPDFVGSLPVAGRTGTLSDRMRGTQAAGRCRAKTGTLHDVSDLAGYCTARDGHTLAFAFLMNHVDPPSARSLQDAMTVSLARYNG